LRLNVNEEAMQVLHYYLMDGYRYCMDQLEQTDPESALQAVSQFLRLSECVDADRWEVADTWLRASRIHYRLGRPGRALVSAGRAFFIRPAISGRPIRRLVFGRAKTPKSESDTGKK